MEAPKAKIKPRKFSMHGVDITDDYYWLREKGNPEVIAYLEAENAYTEQEMAHTKELQEKLYTEMVARIVETDLSVPEQKGNYFYYSRTEKGKNYPVYCRKKGSLESIEEILLDGNLLAEGKSFFRLGDFEVSENHNMLAYSVDFNGSEEYDIYFLDLATGELMPYFIPKTAGTIVWANDNRTLFYSILDETHRPYRLYRHETGSDPESDILVFEEPDPAYFLYSFKTKSRAYILIALESKVTTEMHYMPADRPMEKFRMFSPRKQNVEYWPVHHGEYFYILTNEKALNFKIMQTPVGQTNQENWSEFIPHRDDVYLTNLDAFQNHLVIYCRKNGYKSIEIHHFEGGKTHEVEFPEPVFTFWMSENPEFNTNLLRFVYSSLITPRTVYDYQMDQKSWILKKEYKVLGDYDKSKFVTERHFAKAPDGSLIPVSIAYKKGVKMDGSNPALLYGYGSYGSSLDPYFSTLRLSLLDRGFVYAMAHVRGGSEMGRQWYETGKFLKKQNTFFDFIACAEFMISQNFSSPDKLCISGGSAGGLLMGAVINLRPELFNAVVAHVPFVDVINTMVDESIPLTVIEYEEWGNPNDKTYFEYMYSYSPYDHVEAKEYPHILVTAGLNDPRVQYWEPAKWVARLRALKKGDKTLLLKTNMGAGHSGASGRYEEIKEVAFEYAFILDKSEISD